MSRRSNRPRGRGSRPFVMFYTDMLQHPNFCRLSCRAVKLLVDVSASYTGFNGRNLCSLYALGWHAIDHCKGKHDAMETRKPPDYWKKQAEPFDLSKHLGRGAVFGKADKRI